MKKLSFDILNPRSIILRLLLSFLLLILPLEIAGLFFLSWSKDRMREEIEISVRSSMHYLTRNFEVEISDLYSHLTRLCNNSLFTQFAINHNNFSNIEYYSNLLDQYNLMQDYPAIYPTIEDVAVYYPTLDAVISAKKGFITGQKEEITEKIQYMQTNNALLLNSPNGLFLGISYPVSTLYTQNTPMFFATIELSNDALIDYLDTSSKNYDTLLYIHPLDEVIYSSNTKAEDSYGLYLQELKQLMEENPQETTSSISDNRYFVVSEYSPYLKCSFIQFIPMKEVFHVPNRISLFLMIYTLLSIPIIILFCRIIFKLIVRPIDSLMTGYRKVEAGDYTTALPTDVSSTEFQDLIQGFNKMTSHLHQTIDQLYNYRIFTQKMELKQLQMQMNPHFLYNTYFILHRLIKQESIEEASRLSSYLGSYFQYITRNASDMVPLKKEWEHAENYLKIQEIRYSFRILIVYGTIPDKFADFQVPRLILQPVLENSLEHGLKEIEEGGKLELCCEACAGYLNILINDNGNSLTEEHIQQLESAIHAVDTPDKEFTALHNIHRRLQLVYGNEACLKLTLNNSGGLCVRIIIPCDS